MVGYVIEAVRAIAEAGGVAELPVGDLREEDLPRLGWSGSPLHLRYVREAVARVDLGEVEYLVVREPGGEPIATGGIDFAKYRDAGTLWQLVTHPELRGLGLGSHLVREAMRRIRARGCRWAVIGVEDSNPRARALYERLGFRPFGTEQTSWMQESDSGQQVLHHAQVTLLRRLP